MIGQLKCQSTFEGRVSPMYKILIGHPIKLQYKGLAN